MRLSTVWVRSLLEQRSSHGLEHAMCQRRVRAAYSKISKPATKLLARSSAPAPGCLPHAFIADSKKVIPNPGGSGQTRGLSTRACGQLRKVADARCTARRFRGTKAVTWIGAEAATQKAKIRRMRQAIARRAGRDFGARLVVGVPMENRRFSAIISESSPGGWNGPVISDPTRLTPARRRPRSGAAGPARRPSR